MGYQIQMAAEVGRWLEKLRETDPGTGVLVDEALAVLGDRGASAGPPLVVPVEEQAYGGRPDLDYAYQRQLELLARVRRSVATVATSRKRLELQVNQLEQQASKLQDQQARARQAGRDDLAAEASARQSDVAGQLTDLQAQYASAQSEEEQLTMASQRLQRKVDAFRVRKETIKAAEATAEATAAAAEAEAEIEDAISEAGGPDLAEGASPAAEDRPGQPAQPSPLPLNQPAPLPLQELRPGAPDRSDIRILFTVEPPRFTADPSAAATGPSAAATGPSAGAVNPSGTAVLLAAGTERDWLDAWYADSIPRSRARYERDQGGTR